MTLVRLDSIAAQSWRNGGGRTRELLAWPDASSWKARISVADVEDDGPFSAFPRVDRWFAVLEGAGVELTIDGRPQRLGQHSPPMRFSGAAETTCRLLGGATRDLNLMLRGVGGGMHAVADGVEWRPTHQQCGLYAHRAGRCRADGVATPVPQGSLLWFERAPEVLSFLSDDAAAPAPRGWWLEAGR